MRSAQAAAMAIALGSALLGSCASVPHVVAFQQRVITPAPRSFELALEPGEALPLGISSETITAAAAKAGFVIGGGAPRYRLVLTAAANAATAGSYLPDERQKSSSGWVARPDTSWRARLLSGGILRVTAVLIDGENREAWRGTGTLRTRDPHKAAPHLVEEVLARLPGQL